MFYMMGLSACAMGVSLAANHMQTGGWRGLVFGLLVAGAYAIGRARQASLR